MHNIRLTFPYILWLEQFASWRTFSVLVTFDRNILIKVTNLIENIDLSSIKFA